MNNTMQLYNYQLAIIEKSRTELARHKCVCVSFPTGAGKSVVAAKIIQMMLDKNPRYKVWFYVPRLELIPQIRRTLARFNIFCGEISAKTKDFFNAVCVCSKDTIIRITSTPTPNVIFFDEVHVTIEQQRAIADHFPYAYITGLTATPEIADGRPMLLTNQPNSKTLGLYQALVLSNSIPELQKLGALAGLDYKGACVPSSVVENRAPLLITWKARPSFQTSRRLRLFTSVAVLSGSAALPFVQQPL
jgi:superfamily II DNA or RNA helicase